MAEPMSSGGAFIGWHLSAVDCAGTSALAQATGYYDIHNVFISKVLPAGWTPMLGTGGGGGGGGSSTVFDYFTAFLPSGQVLNDTRYPDFGNPGIANSQRELAVDVAAPYTLGTWRKMSAVLYVVAANLPSPVVATLRLQPAGTSIASITFNTASAPDARGKIRQTVSIATGTVADGSEVQLHVEQAPANNAYALQVTGTYQLS